MDPAKPLVGVIMGSDSDLPCMAAACEKLKQFGVRFTRCRRRRSFPARPSFFAAPVATDRLAH